LCSNGAKRRQLRLRCDAGREMFTRAFTRHLARR
jgi:hypothetical protein